MTEREHLLKWAREGGCATDTFWEILIAYLETSIGKDEVERVGTIVAANDSGDELYFEGVDHTIPYPCRVALLKPEKLAGEVCS